MRLWCLRTCISIRSTNKFVSTLRFGALTVEQVCRFGTRAIETAIRISQCSDGVGRCACRASSVGGARQDHTGIVRDLKAVKRPECFALLVGEIVRDDGANGGEKLHQRVVFVGILGYKQQELFGRVTPGYSRVARGASPRP